MKIKPILPFRAVVAGSAYPKTFTPEDELDPDSEAAKAALDLGCLSDEHAKVVTATLALSKTENDADAEAKAKAGAEPKAKADAEAKAGQKSQGAAPETKAVGTED